MRVFGRLQPEESFHELLLVTAARLPPNMSLPSKSLDKIIQDIQDRPLNKARNYSRNTFKTNPCLQKPYTMGV